MAFDLSSISRSRKDTPVVMTLCGPPKIGKTTSVAGLRNIIFLPTEDGTSHVDTDVFPLAKNLQDVYSAIQSLITQPHTYETLAIDSVDWLEPFIQQHVCTQNGWPSVEAAPYGRGYVAAAAEFKIFLEGISALKNKGMHIIFIAHEKIKRIDSPLLPEGFDAYQLKLHDRTQALLTEFCDVLAFCGYKTITKSVDAGFGQKEIKALAAGERMLFLEAHPAIPSGNRLGWKDTVLSSQNLQALLDSAKPVTQPTKKEKVANG